MNDLKLSSVLLKCINEIGDYFEYAYACERDKEFVMGVIGKMTKELKDKSNG